MVFFSISASNELVFINFYADWCRFSNLLQPIFDEAADLVRCQNLFFLFFTFGVLVIEKKNLIRIGSQRIQ